MEKIKIAITGRVASVVALPEVVADNAEYEVDFALDPREGWDMSLPITALFVRRDGSYTPRIMDAGETSCTMPPQTGTNIVFVGLTQDDMRTTTPATIKVHRSIRTVAHDPLPAPSEDVYAQILAAYAGIKTISGKGAPTSATQGKVNQLYRDENTQRLYICTAADGGYTWAVSGGSVDVDATLTKVGYAADAKAAGDAIGKKIDKNQGVESAGMILGVDEDGNVVPQNKPAQAIAGAAAPTTATAGVVGQEYYVITDGVVAEMYVCTAAANGTYAWNKVELGAEIDDTSTEQTKVWSAKKSNQLSQDVAKLKEKKAEIDDTAVGANAWSSQNIVDMLCPPIQESGNPVVCYPVAVYPLGVKAKWEPVQEGSGTPSPENIRPIKGRDSVTVTRCGENLLNVTPFKAYTEDGITYEYVPDGGVKIKGTATRAVDSPVFNTILPPGKYYGLDMGTGVSASFVVVRKGAYLWLNAKGAFEILAGDICKYWYMIASNGSTVDMTVYPYIVKGTTAPTTYTLYIGTTNTMTLPETVYGGEVDAVTGEGIKNWKRVVFDGTENWNSRPAKYTSYSLALPMSAQTGFCTHFKKILYDAIRPDTGTGETGCYLEFSSSAIFNVPYENVGDWKNFLAAQYAAGTPVYIVYQYANEVNEPFTATGAQALPALAGLNTILTDADSATVTGRADPIKRITDLEAAVASIN